MSGGWNTIESDAGVFTYLVEKLGVKDVQFEELISLDPESLRQYGPVYGVIFLFKYPTNEPAPGADRSKPQDGSYDYNAAENLFFASQVIQNACGTQALLSVLLNKDGTSPAVNDTQNPSIDIGERLRDFKDFTGSFPADLRGEALSNSELIRDVHNSFARSAPFVDETQRAATEDDDVYHFIAYTCLQGKLYELDGLQPAPIAHGDCTPDEFPEKVVPVLQRRIGRYPIHEIRFNLMALVRDQRLIAQERGDNEDYEREEAKRREWMWENALRRHNFLGFTAEMLKEVVKGKVQEGTYDEWVKGAVDSTKRKLEAARAAKKATGGDAEGMDLGM